MDSKLSKSNDASTTGNDASTMGNTSSVRYFIARFYPELLEAGPFEEGEIQDYEALKTHVAENCFTSGSIRGLRNHISAGLYLDLEDQRQYYTASPSVGCRRRILMLVFLLGNLESFVPRQIDYVHEGNYMAGCNEAMDKLCSSYNEESSLLCWISERLIVAGHGR